VRFSFANHDDREQLQRLISGIRTSLADADTPPAAVTVH
jgi:hypothetical protein